MRNAEPLRHIRRQRGQRGLPGTDASRLLSQRALALRAEGTLSRNQGALTPGRTVETGEGRSLEPIDPLSNAWRDERYRWGAFGHSDVSRNRC
jgi:hypothetical protein